MLGTVPLEPILLWREQLITEEDVFVTEIANKETLEALEEIARRLTDDLYWGRYLTNRTTRQYISSTGSGRLDDRVGMSRATF